MERLTIEYNGQFMPREMCTMDRFGGADDCETCDVICGEFIETGCTECPIQRAFERLAEYEDLGLTPDQLKEVDKLYTEKCKQISDMSRYIVEKLDDVPTAYDVDKVVEQLEELRGNELDGIRKGISDIELMQSIRGQNILNDAIEIVKSGGMNKEKEVGE